MEGRDVDAVAPAQASEITDESRLVVIAKIEKRVREIGFDGDRLDLDDPGLVAAHKRSSDRPFAATMATVTRNSVS